MNSTGNTRKRRYSVNLYYHSCVPIDIEASSEEEAVEIANGLEPTARQILQNLQYEGNDVREIPDDETSEEPAVPCNPTIAHRVDISGIDWDTSDWDSELTDPHSANVPDLPREIEDAEIEWGEDDDPEEAIGEWLSNIYGFCVNSFNYEEKDN